MHGPYHSAEKHKYNIYKSKTNKIKSQEIAHTNVYSSKWANIQTINKKKKKDETKQKINYKINKKTPKCPTEGFEVVHIQTENGMAA